MGRPPVVGSVHEAVTEALPAVTDGAAGLAGTVAAGVTGTELFEGCDVPIEFWARTANVYGVPSVSPVTMQLGFSSVTGEQVRVPGEDVTV